MTIASELPLIASFDENLARRELSDRSIDDVFSSDGLLSSTKPSTVVARRRQKQSKEPVVGDEAAAFADRCCW